MLFSNILSGNPLRIQSDTISVVSFLYVVLISAWLDLSKNNQKNPQIITTYTER